MDTALIEKRRRQVLLDEKWKKFLRRTWLFRYVPFVDFAFGAGSMATGNVNENSDFDVIIGARDGRIFSARFFAVILFGAFGWRRSRIDHRETARDKICLNHFVTSRAFSLAPPHHAYWENLYRNLVPLFGNREKIRSFWAANEAWMKHGVSYCDDLRHKYREGAYIKSIIEKICSGRFGDGIERILKHMQVRRIERGLKASGDFYEPRIRFDDTELEFHPDTRRIKHYSGRS
jgi:hypothetical protein